MGQSKLNIKKKGDYSYALLNEISWFFRKLPESNFISSNQFIEIKNKLSKAKTLGINVEKYEQEIYDFRCTLLKRRILNKIEELSNISIKSIENQCLFEITTIEDNYKELKNDYSDTNQVEKFYNELLEIVTYVKISFMIEKYLLGDYGSNFDFESIINEMNKAEKKGINIKKLRMKILGD